MDTHVNAYDASKEELLKSPKRKPKFRMWHYQWIGLPLLFLIPALALLGVFGSQNKKIEFSGEALEGSIEYPEKLRFGQSEFVRLEIKNPNDSAISNLTIAFDKKYIEEFAENSFTPEVQSNYEVKNVEIPANESESFEVRVKAGPPGSHSGKITIRNNKKEFLSKEISTYVFP